MSNNRRKKEKVENLISDISVLLQAQQRFHESEVLFKVESKNVKKNQLARKPRAETIEEIESDMKQLRDLEERLIYAQISEGGIEIPDTTEDRTRNFAAFKQWMLTNAPNCLVGEAYDFDFHVEEGCGVVAIKDLAEDELFLRVPRRLAMSSDSCLAAPVGEVVRQDDLCLSMPSLALALHVLFEKLDPTSFWQPYLRVLPPLSRMTLPMLFNDEQLQGYLLQLDWVYDQGYILSHTAHNIVITII